MLLRQLLFIVLINELCRANYSNKWLIKGYFTNEEVHRIAEGLGFRVLKKVILIINLSSLSYCIRIFVLKSQSYSLILINFAL